MRIDDPVLCNQFKGRDVYVVGSGPSMRLFDVRFLLGKPTIALNQAWRYWTGTGAAPTLGLTVHPELVQEYNREYVTAPETAPLPVVAWAVKRKPPMEGLTLDDRRYYVFKTNPDFATLAARPADTLFIGRGVQQTAMDLAARLGARAIVLVGVDMAALGGDHHGHDQHVQFHGLAAEDVYLEYVTWTRKARTLITQRWGIPILTLSPFLGAGRANEDYEHLCRERGLSPLPAPPDVSTYMRKQADL